jgi:hypothetical protein
MSAAIQQCPTGPGKPDPCEELAKKIDEVVNRDKRQEGDGGRHGLKHRFREQIEGANGPPGSGVGDPAVWEEHDRVIRRQQQTLRDLLNEFNKNSCGDRVPIPADAWEWATKPAPEPAQWKGPAQAVPTPAPAPDRGFMKKMSEVTGLTGVALLIYVVVSEGSRVLFPPRNLVPVP